MLRFVIGHQEGGENIEQTDTLTRQLLYRLAYWPPSGAFAHPLGRGVLEGHFSPE